MTSFDIKIKEIKNILQLNLIFFKNYLLLLFLECCRYYESIGVYDKASTMLRKCGEYEQALRLILQLGTHEAMELVQFDILIKLEYKKLVFHILKSV